MIWTYNDGGRAAAGFKGSTGDCVVRAVAIATQLPYATVYAAVNDLSRSERLTARRRTRSSARAGVRKATIRRFLADLGWAWTPTMRVGSGCRVHLTDGELPGGRLIVQVSRHLTAVIDGVIHDTHDPQRGDSFRFDAEGRYQRLSGGRCVYGYWRKEETL